MIMQVKNVESGTWQGRKTSQWEEKVKEFNGHERIIEDNLQEGRGPRRTRKGGMNGTKYNDVYANAIMKGISVYTDLKS